MRQLVLTVALGCIVSAADVQAQSVEESYAAMCSRGQQSETCDALRRALAEPAEGQRQSDLATNTHVDPVWGPLTGLAGTAWAIHGGGIVVMARFEWIEPGKKLKYRGGLVGLPMTEIIFRPGDEPGVVLGDINSFDETTRNVPFRFNDDGVLLSDWYRWGTIFGTGGTNQRHEFRLTADGRFEGRTAVGDSGEQPAFPPLHGKYQKVAADVLADMSAESSATIAELTRQAELARLEQERRDQEARSARWSQVMGAVSGALDAGLEVARAQEAQSAYELDRTLSDINARAAAQQRAAQQSSPPVSTQGPRANTSHGGSPPGVTVSGQSATPRENSSLTSVRAATGDASGGDGASAPLTVVFWKGFRTPITPGATSNEACFARVQLGPVTSDSSKRLGEAKRTASSAEQQFLSACRRLGELAPGGSADEFYMDEAADSAYRRYSGNRWMHEVSVR